MKIISLAAGAVAALALCQAGVAPRAQLYRFNYENVLGTSLEIRLAAASETAAEKARDAALGEIERGRKILSGYDPASEFSRWTGTHGKAVAVSPELYEVLGLFDFWRERTGGALDASAETVSRAWKKAEREHRLPTGAELSAAAAAVRQRHWALGPDGTATHLSDAPLVLNSFAKSYIASRAADSALREPGVTGAVVNIGGDLVVRGTLTEPVAIADPFDAAENAAPIGKIAVHDRAVATSGNYRRGFEIGGAHYSHIVDPRTGRTAEDVASSTVAARDASTAGALATAFSVMKPAESVKLAASLPGVDFLIVKRNGERLTSPGWRSLAVPLSPLPAAAAEGMWDPSMELDVGFEIAHIDDFRSRRPYIAVWIEDQDKYPVRLLAIWYQKSRYLDEMKGWYRSERLRAMAEHTPIPASASGATRPPGKYTVKWDGKDNAGKYVKEGRYTVYIEAAREHGTYQLMRHPADFAETPWQARLPGNTEIPSAALEYRKTVR